MVPTWWARWSPAAGAACSSSPQLSPPSFHNLSTMGKTARSFHPECVGGTSACFISPWTDRFRCNQSFSLRFGSNFAPKRDEIDALHREPPPSRALPRTGTRPPTGALLPGPPPPYRGRLPPTGGPSPYRGPLASWGPWARVRVPPTPGKAPPFRARLNAGRGGRPQRLFHSYRYGSQLVGGRCRGQAGELDLDMEPRTAGASVCPGGLELAHRGTLPCLRAGGSWRLVAKTSRLWARARRVLAGSMTSSM
jgi:hypothetical protein